jgi:hypothetical protein
VAAATQSNNIPAATQAVGAVEDAAVQSVEVGGPGVAL